MKKMIVVAVSISITVGFCLLSAKRRLGRRYTVIDCASQEVQAVVAEVNSGIGEGGYDKILIFHGKDSFLLSSCVASEIDWRRISSMGEPREGKSVMEQEMLVAVGDLLNPLGCFRLDGIDYYGFARGGSEVYLIIDNFGDERGKFPKKFWDVISRNAK